MSARRSAPRAFAFLAALSLVTFAGAVIAGDSKRDLKTEERLRKDSKKVEDSHSRDLIPIIKFCVDKKLKSQGLDLVATIERISPDWEKTPELKATGDLKKQLNDVTPSSSDADVKDYQKKLDFAQSNYANKLMGLAMDCAKNGLITRAYDLIQSVLDANPNHEKANKIMGRVHVNNEWISKFEQKLRDLNVLYKNKQGEIQGWVPKKDVARWDKGERPLGTNLPTKDTPWLAEDEETRKCQLNEQRMWEVESEHFKIRTNISRTAAYEFGQLLEDYYKAFFRVFINFYDTDPNKGLELLFNVKPLENKLVVLYFPSRSKYLVHVHDKHGNDELLHDSDGFYGGGGDCAHDSHFFYVPDRTRTLDVTYHEVTHQLFGETKEEKSGSKGNNWIVEGIAMYCETWGKDARGKWVPGLNKDHDDLVGAKHFLKENPKWNLAEFVTIDHDSFHKSNRHLNYAMSQALCYFCMHYDDERYKEDFVHLISLHYGGKTKENSLYELLQIVDEKGNPVPSDKKMETLEKQFREFMDKEIPDVSGKRKRKPGDGAKKPDASKPKPDEGASKADDDDDDAKKDDSKKKDSAKKGDDSKKKGDDDDDDEKKPDDSKKKDDEKKGDDSKKDDEKKKGDD